MNEIPQEAAVIDLNEIPQEAAAIDLNEIPQEAIAIDLNEIPLGFDAQQAVALDSDAQVQDAISFNAHNNCCEGDFTKRSSYFFQPNPQSTSVRDDALARDSLPLSFSSSSSSLSESRNSAVCGLVSTSTQSLLLKL